MDWIGPNLQVVLLKPYYIRHEKSHPLPEPPLVFLIQNVLVLEESLMDLTALPFGYLGWFGWTALWSGRTLVDDIRPSIDGIRQDGCGLIGWLRRGSLSP